MNQIEMMQAAIKAGNSTVAKLVSRYEDAVNRRESIEHDNDKLEKYLSNAEDELRYAKATENRAWNNAIAAVEEQ